MIRSPLYAAGIAAGLTLVKKLLDWLIAGRTDTIGGYLKDMIFSALMVGVWVWLLQRSPGTSGMRSSGMQVPQATPPFQNTGFASNGANQFNAF